MSANVAPAKRMVNTETGWNRIRQLRQVIVEHREEGDRLRRLPDSIARAFLEADAYRLLIPQDLGGLGLDLPTVFDLGVEVSSYDGSAGWNFGIGCGAAPFLGGFPLARIEEVFSVPDCCMAGSGSPPGRAMAADGG